LGHKPSKNPVKIVKRALVQKNGSNKLKGSPASYQPLDWKNLFGLPRDQNPCGDCYAFSVSGVLEAFYNKKKWWRSNLFKPSTDYRL